MLKLEGVEKQIGDFVLTADFSVREGERVALVGRSGCGKTTLLRIIAGLTSLDRGHIFKGKDELTALPPEKRGMGVVFQEQALFPSMNVLDNVSFGLQMQGTSKAKRHAVAMSWLERVGLVDRAHSDVALLSGGERQRVAFVRALVWKPSVLLLDEPFSALDSSLRHSIQKELIQLHQLWPVPLLLVTHDSGDVDAVATRKICVQEDENQRRRTFAE